ncbi:Alpha/Beta hydrolase protein [Aspergillus cavernicola]|uniref:Alpha/Beta hydrolase protein n=1 Tax=Aspergillus cavernicola TaxID=176166 RepID=A0ABR4I8H3_9EURO
MSLATCCLKTFSWDGTPAGRIGKLDQNSTYITGDNPNLAILIVHDLLGWSFPNVRLLADHYAREANATVYVPDFFDGEVLPFEPLIAGRFHEVDLPAFRKRNSRDIREPEVFRCAAALRGIYKVTAAVGFCYGGWAVFRLGAEHPSSSSPLGGVDQRPLVDCITAAHPSMLTEEDIDGVVVPVQILAPELDPIFTPELKRYTFDSLQRRGVPFDWQHFPKVEHACMSRGDLTKPGEGAALERGKNALVAWVRQIVSELEVKG